MAPSTKLILNRRGICAYIGEDANYFPLLVKDGLPAYRTSKNGRWKARVEDLDKWIDLQAKKYLKH